jgi:hypothetical protein
MNISQFLEFLGQFDLRIEGPGELSRIADKFGSDKGFQGGQGHLYTQFYEKLTNQIRYEKFDLVEIGLLSAHQQNNFDRLGYKGMYASEQGQTYYDYPSLKMWAEFFPFARILGLDKEKFLIDERDSRIEYKYFNAENPSTIVPILSDICPKVILDDASHIFKHQQDTFFNAFDYLAPGGIYIIEDLNSIQGKFVEGYEPTEKIFIGGEKTLRTSPSYLANPDKGEHILTLIESMNFSVSLQTGKQNTVCIKKRG